MAHPFYPFVDNDSGQESGQTSGRAMDPASPEQALSAGVVNYSARIAVYDDAAAAPRVVVVDPTDVRSYLEEITSQVTQLSHEQGGGIPFMVIREVVENFIHAYFIEPTISILDHGNTIRFSDQGPGIKEKDRALEYGTSSATDDMKRYIRGVGSGLPYAQQYMQDKGGSLTIEDNISQGTVVTISTHPATSDNVRPHQDSQQAQGIVSSAPQPQQGLPTQTWQQPLQPAQDPQQAMWQQPWQAAAPQQQPYQGQPYQPQQQAPYPYQQASWAPQPVPQQTFPQPPAPAAQDQFSWVSLTARGQAILDYLALHDSVGPTELAREYGESQPTWTRELKALEEDGILKKDGQKRRLTRMGQAFLQSRRGT